MDHTRKDLVKLLAEAHSNELGLVNVLNSHIPIAQNDAYRELLEHHLDETRGHAERIQQRLDDLGYSESMFTVAYGAAQAAIKQIMVLGKAPVDMIRGGADVKEKMLRNARDEVMTEGLEIATYDAIESIARSLGDSVTAELAASIRLDEEAMFDSLRKLIPVLAADVAAQADPYVGTKEPWDGYDDMTVDEITTRLKDSSISQVLAVREYEMNNKNRKTLVEAADPDNIEL
jgi:ferritin-like metal-binding protein YciE